MVPKDDLTEHFAFKPDTMTQNDKVSKLIMLNILLKGTVTQEDSFYSCPIFFKDSSRFVYQATVNVGCIPVVDVTVALFGASVVVDD